MTDQISRHVASKLTHGQKRGKAAGRASNLEFHNDRRTMDITKSREPHELRSAQRALAELALEQPDAQEWLHDVLDALGLRYVVKDPLVAKEEFRSACYPYAGTLRGYELHLRSYTKPCNMCDAVGRAAEAARLQRLGIEMEQSGTWTIS